MTRTRKTSATRAGLRTKAAAVLATVALAMGVGALAAAPAQAATAHLCRDANPACNT
ncbi:hypothetical protein ABT024_37050 [Streptomyces sp. NPDC002812]|uniref:hypothetical protein n=1 Tax=unclassified Streptomyces TaxID=2593676 RepID=UPI00202E1776|nr:MULTISPECIES: hypothetical protein [unclassified Streptomyces]MCM1965724.1 hypothetical protein [Streptomyces sp. G1]MCX5123840.1 hypothetical protein [Streptomyces sp. NBC_00347]MCX5297085.1 hypothetical protein [Streptomyces sp. NBC_00193]